MAPFNRAKSQKLRHNTDLVAILQVLADAREIGDNGDAKPFQFCARAHARQHQELRTVVRASSHDDFTFGVYFAARQSRRVGKSMRVRVVNVRFIDVFDANRAASVK